LIQSCIPNTANRIQVITEAVAALNSRKSYADITSIISKGRFPGVVLPSQPQKEAFKIPRSSPSPK
jgi:hypothetical protein